nr:hypothetical protein [Planobispora longispora]
MIDASGNRTAHSVSASRRSTGTGLIDSWPASRPGVVSRSSVSMVSRVMRTCERAIICRARSGGRSGWSSTISRKPLTAASGERSSCETTATRWSRRALARRSSSLCRDSSSAWRRTRR